MNLRIYLIKLNQKKSNMKNENQILKTKNIKYLKNLSQLLVKNIFKSGQL